MRSVLSLLLLMVVGVSVAEDSGVTKPPPEIRVAVEKIVHDAEGLREYNITTIKYGSALGGRRTDMLVVDLEAPAEAEARAHRLGVRLWFEQDKAAPHGFKLVDSVNTIDETTLRDDMSVETYEAIVKALQTEMPKAHIPFEIGDENFGAPELPPLGLSVQYFGLIKVPGSHIQQWLYFGEVEGVIQLVATVKKIAIE